MAQTTCRRWVIRFGLVLVVTLLSACSGALEGAAPSATVSPTAIESLKSGQTATPTSLSTPTAAQPTAATTSADPSVVDGWIGTIVALDPMAQYDDYFLRQDGERYGIDGSAGGLTSQIESARRQGAAVQVWGLLLTGVPDVDGRQIVVKRLDMVSVPGAAGIATPCAQRPIALPEPARFDPLPDARGAIAVSTAGGGFGLVIPDTGAVVPIHALVPWCGQQVRQADRGLAWSPDGRRIAFIYSEYGPPQEEQLGYLMLADLERGELRPLL